MNILLVEDDPAVRAALERLVRAKGHTVCWASSGEGAIRLLDSEPIDVVLLDMSLDGRLSGWDVARYKFLTPRLSKIPVIVISGMAEAEVRERARTNVLEGAVLILGKPVDAGLLFRTLAAIERGDLTPPVGLARSGFMALVIKARCSAGHVQELVLGDAWDKRNADALAGVLREIMLPRGCGSSSPEDARAGLPCGAAVTLEVAEEGRADAPAGLAVRWTP